jgi:hypothetical protein
VYVPPLYVADKLTPVKSRSLIFYNPEKLSPVNDVPAKGAPQAVTKLGASNDTNEDLFWKAFAPIVYREFAFKVLIFELVLNNVELIEVILSNT